MINRLLKLSISIVFYIIYKSVVLIFNLNRKPFPGTKVILTYHSIKDEHRSKFAKQMDELIKVGSHIPADFDNPLKSGQHYIAVTFDDGYQNVLKNALPAMYERNIPATIFVTTSYLGQKPIWISNPNNENANEILITEQQLKQLPDNLITIGSHCVTHPRLSKIDKDRAFKELVKSKKTLEAILNTDIVLFSLPYGSYNKGILELAKTAGYKRVFKNIPTFPSSKIEEYLIGRIGVSLDDWYIEYRLKLEGAYQWLPIGIFIKRKFINFTKKSSQ